MTPEQFCYWLQGRAEMQPDNPPSEAEWAMIREHLATVFVKVTPPIRIPGQIVKDGPNHLITPGLPLPHIAQWPQTPTDLKQPPYTVECSAVC